MATSQPFSEASLRARNGVGACVQSNPRFSLVYYRLEEVLYDGNEIR